MSFDVVLALIVLAAIPGLLGEGVAQMLKRWPWVGYVLGGLLAAALIFVGGISLVLCEVADDYHEPSCDEQASLGAIVGIVGALAAVVLTVLALAYRQQAVLRWLLWGTPVLCLTALAVGVEIVSD